MKKLSFGALALLPFTVYAAVPAAVTTAITDASADASTVAGGVIGVIVVIFGFLMMRKALR